MNPVGWELELKFKDTDQYLKFMKKFLKIEKKRRSLATEFYVRSDDTGANHEAIIVTIYCVWGERLQEYADLIKKIEEEK